MMPGLSGSAIKFARQVEDLRANFRVIAIDPRGHGESSNADTGYTFHTCARDLHDVITILGLDDIALLGHSAACKIIWTYFDIYDTSHVKRLILPDERSHMRLGRRVHSAGGRRHAGRARRT